ncbi:MAG: hypothetical protein KGJ32_12490 [Xanthomonadaceae bacterium]|nr:hypothetical protein [Xanthomonadaceae bacterium]
MESIEGKRSESVPEWLFTEEVEEDDEVLTTLFSNLQGLGEEAVVGAGLARFNPLRLAAIQHAAELKMGQRLHGLSALLHVLTLAREFADRLPRHVIRDVTAHLRLQTQELACWRELAKQAAYIRENPDFACLLAHQYVQCIEASDEWPKG